MSTAHLASTGGLAANTWGVSGPAFLGGYVLLGIALVGAIALAVRPPRVPGDRAIPAKQLTSVQLGLLAGGGPLAVTVALADLRRLELVDVTGCPISPADPSGRPLLEKRSNRLDGVTLAVHEAIGVSRRDRLTPTALVRRPAVAAALDDARRRLAAAGLLTTPLSRSARKLAGAAGAAFVALGIARAVAGSANNKAIGFLVLVISIAVVVIPIQLVSSSASRPTRSAKVVLRDLRQKKHFLSPRLSPSWTTYGPESIVLATALFGGAVMYAADPIFAQAVDVNKALIGLSTGGGSGFVSGGSVSGGCGGGGCGGGGGGGCGG